MTIDIRREKLMLALAVVTSLAIAAATPADAQKTPPAITNPAPSPTPTAVSPPPASSDDQTGDIIVTAQKRSERIRDVGMAITAATGDTLVERGITDPSQLAKIEPAFQFAKSSYGSPVYSLRGVGFYDTSLGATPAVTVYQDQIPIPYSIMTRSASFDLERVEVLKGPQGTLYGQNSTGGAINYIAAKPTSILRTGLDVSFGRFDSLDTTGFVSGPITSTLSARIAVHAEESGDWQRSYTRDDGLGRADRLYGRVLLDWRPTDTFKFELNVNGGRDHSDSAAGQLIAVNNQRLSSAVRNYPLAPRDARAADWDAGVDFARNDSQYLVAGLATLDLSPTLALASITSYQHYNLYNPQDVDGTALDIFTTLDRGNIDTVSQELRLQTQAQARFNWIVGANYSHDRVFDSLVSMGPDGAPGLSGAPNANPQNEQRVDSVGIFANGEYALTDRLKAQGGVRYTKQWRDFDGCSYDTGDGLLAAARSRLAGVPGLIQAGGCATLDAQLKPGVVHSELNEDNVSWRAALNWKVAPSSLLYASISKGYKAGAYPTAGATYSSTYAPAVQESLLSYEAGFKLTLADRLLQLDGAVFYYDYRNKQIRGRVLDPLLGSLNRLVNIPRSNEFGVELAATLRPARGLTIATSGIYLDTKIKGSFVNLDALGSVRELAGEAFPYTPKWSGNGSIDYEFGLTPSLKAVVGTELAYKSATYAGLGEISLFRIPAYAQLDLRLGVASPDNRWRVTIWGRNVTNTYYWNNVISPTSDTILRYAAMPATYGITLNFRFG